MTTTPAPSINVITPSGTSVGPWTTGWKFAAPEDVWVYVETDGIAGPDLALGSDFTLVAANPTVSGGSVTLDVGIVPEGGWDADRDRVVIRRWTPRRQGVGLPDTEGHKPRATERALDRQMRIAEEQDDEIQRVAITTGAVADPAVIEAAVTAQLPEIVGDQFDGKLNLDGGNMTEGAAPAFLAALGGVNAIGGGVDPLGFKAALGLFFFAVEDFGAEANDPSFDNTTAINDAEAAAAVFGAQVAYRQSASYYFKGTLRIQRNRFSWAGDRTRLVYNGASTTRDALIIGNEATINGALNDADPALRPTYYVEGSLRGISLESLTLMTAGWAVRCPGLCRSVLHFDNIGSQDFAEGRAAANAGYVGIHPVTGDPVQTGLTWFNGIWFQHVDNVRITADAVNAINIPGAVNGRAEAAGGGPKADLWWEVRKASGRLGSFVMGGGFGGLYLTAGTTFIGGDGSMLINESLTSEGNREVIDTGAVFDEARGIYSGANIVIDEPGTGGRSVQFIKVGGWIAACYAGHGIHIKQHKGKVFIDAPIRGNGKDGARIDDALSVCHFADEIYDNGLQALAAGAPDQTWYGINPTVPNHAVTWGASLVYANRRKVGGVVYADRDVNRTQASLAFLEQSNTRLPILDVLTRITLPNGGYFGASPDSGNMGLMFRTTGGARGFFHDPGTSSFTWLLDNDAVPILRMFGGGLVLGEVLTISHGPSAPNGLRNGRVGSLYLRTDGGAASTLYVKESGDNTNTGWVAK